MEGCIVVVVVGGGGDGIVGGGDDIVSECDGIVGECRLNGTLVALLLWLLLVVVMASLVEVRAIMLIT